MKVTGVSGAVQVGGHPAASIVSWSLTSVAPGSYEFAGTLSHVDPFWITQAPQELRLTVGAATWMWRGVLLTVAGSRASSILPRPEVRV